MDDLIGNTLPSKRIDTHIGEYVTTHEFVVGDLLVGVYKEYDDGTTEIISYVHWLSKKEMKDAIRPGE